MCIRDRNVTLRIPLSKSPLLREIFSLSSGSSVSGLLIYDTSGALVTTTIIYDRQISGSDLVIPIDLGRSMSSFRMVFCYFLENRLYNTTYFYSEKEPGNTSSLRGGFTDALSQEIRKSVVYVEYRSSQWTKPEAANCPFYTSVAVKLSTVIPHR